MDSIKELSINDFINIKIKELTNVLKEFGYEITKEELENAKQKQAKIYNELIQNGLDIGTLVKQIIKGKVVYYNDSIMFQDNKSKKLYYIDNVL